jgi:hypothetical protein
MVSRLRHGPGGSGTTRRVPAPWVWVPKHRGPTGWVLNLLKGPGDPVGPQQGVTGFGGPCKDPLGCSTFLGACGDLVSRMISIILSIKDIQYRIQH